MVSLRESLYDLSALHYAILYSPKFSMEHVETTVANLTFYEHTQTLDVLSLVTTVDCNGLLRENTVVLFLSSSAKLESNINIMYIFIRQTAATTTKSESKTNASEG